MLLDHQIEAPHREDHGKSLALDEEALGVERTRHLAVAGQPLGTFAARQRADQGAEILGQRQLGQADLVVDLRAFPGRTVAWIDRSTR